MVGIVEIVLSFIELKYFHGVATPALLCHKELTARGFGTQNTPRLVLYGIRDRWLPWTEKSYYRRPYADKEPARISDDHDLGPDLGSLQCSTLIKKHLFLRVAL